MTSHQSSAQLDNHTTLGGIEFTHTDVTIARVIVGNRSYTGVAKRDPRDNYNAEIAFDLALARALSSAARKLERRAMNMTRNADLVRERRATAETDRQSAQKRAKAKRTTQNQTSSAATA